MAEPGDLQTTPLEEGGFAYFAPHGTKFQASHCDLRNGMTVRVPKDLSRENLLQDFAEMMTYHRVGIRPELPEKRRRGFALLTYTIIEE